jgi:DNA-binding NarL/FixJ family response regulator
VTIRIVLADDHPIVRSGIRNELIRQADIDVVGEAVDSGEALRLVAALQPDVLLLDINMPGPKAVHILHDLRTQPNAPHVLVLTAHGDRENVVGMLRAGATGYMLKDEDPAAIVEAVRAVAQGRTWLSAAVTRSLYEQPERAQEVVEELLSEREIAVLKLLALGDANAQIADKLHISEATVKNHVTNIYTQLNVHTRAEAVAWAWQHGAVGGRAS